MSCRTQASGFTPQNSKSTPLVGGRGPNGLPLTSAEARAIYDGKTAGEGDEKVAENDTAESGEVEGGIQSFDEGEYHDQTASAGALT